MGLCDHASWVQCGERQRTNQRWFGVDACSLGKGGRGGGVYIFSVVRSCWSGWIELYERRSEDDDKSRGLVMEEEEQQVSSS